jgi:TM2 domain-containing membrane protein YozV
LEGAALGLIIVGHLFVGLAVLFLPGAWWLKNNPRGNAVERTAYLAQMLRDLKLERFAKRFVKPSS